MTTTSKPAFEMRFTASGRGLYVLAPDADALAIYDQITARQLQMKALLTLTYGEGAEGFNSLNDVTRGNYMWAIDMLSREIDDLTSALEQVRTAEQSAEAAA